MIERIFGENEQKLQFKILTNTAILTLPNAKGVSF